MSTTDPLASCIRTVDCSATADATLAGRLTLFTNAIAAARYGDLIVTEPGDVLDGNWTLPKQTLGTVGLYTVIRPKNFDSNVAFGRRATSSHTTYMTKLRSSASSVGAGRCDPILSGPTSGGTHYYWISGMEIVPKASCYQDIALVNFGPIDNAENPANQSDHMMIDRCYIHTDESGTNGGLGGLRGVMLCGTYQGVMHSTIDGIKTLQAGTVAGAGGDNQGVYGSFGAGPYHIENNTLGATCMGVLFETPTGETFTAVTLQASQTVITRSGGLFNYDIVGKTLNLVGSNTVTVVTRDSDTQITVTPALTGLTYTAGSFTGSGYINYDRSGNPGFFPGDITIKRNYFRKKAAWNITSASFERTSGTDTYGGSNISLTIDATSLNKGTNSPVAFVAGTSEGRQFWVTGGTGFTTGYCYITAVDVSGVATFNRNLGTTLGATGGTATTGYASKNLLEFKSGSRTLIEDNVFDTHWAGGGQNYALTFTPRYTNSPTGDVTFQYNKMTNVYSILSITGCDDGPNGGGTPPPWLQQNRVLFQHCLFENVKNSASGDLFTYGADKWMIQFVPHGAPGTINGVAGSEATINDFVFDHITIAGSGCVSENPNFVMGDGGTAPTTKASRFILRNSAIYAGATANAGVVANRLGGAADTTAMNVYTLNSTADTRVVTKNYLFDTTLDGTTFASPDTSNTFSANHSGVGFTDYAGGDYTITGVNATAATDGTMIGADIATLNRRTAGAITGVWPARLYLPIRWP